MQQRESEKKLNSMLLSRAGEYDRSHSEANVKSELAEFLSKHPAFSIYIRKKRLSDCPIELIKGFLNWKEPGLYE